MTNVPSLTRVVSLDGVKVSLFVEHLTASNTLPTVVTHARPATFRPGGITRRGLLFHRRNRNRLAGYTLWASVVGKPESARLVAPRTSLATKLTASLAGPGDVIFAVVPDDVAGVRWSWPRRFDTSTLKHDPTLTIEAAADQNVVIARAARFLPPPTATWYATNGQVIDQINDPNGSAGPANNYTTNDSPTPVPETALSRRAERNPATPNSVVIAPNVPSKNPDRQFFFHVLLNHRTYFMRVTGGPHRCITPNPGYPHGPGYGAVLHPGAEPTVRGDTFEATATPDGVHCAGTYRLSISVLNDHNQPYPPFGSADFTVR